MTPFIIKGQTGLNSQEKLEEIFDIYPEYKKDIYSGIAQLIDLSVISNSGVAVHQFNKIRFKLDAIEKRHGFPMRLHHTVAFFDLLMFSIPFYTQLQVNTTIISWDNDRPDKIPATERVDMRFRKVLIKIIPNEQQYDLIGVIPFGFANTVAEIDELLALATTRVWNLFENLVTYSGMNNKFIICNWDKIVKRLNDYGR